MPLNFDIQVAGVSDDGGPTGRVLTETVSAGLVFLPFSQLSYFHYTIGGSVNPNRGAYYNTDGSQSGLSVSVPNTPGDFSFVYVPFYGDKFGVRMRNDAAPFDVQVDAAEIVPVELPQAFQIKEGLQSANNYEVRQLTHTNLGPGYHLATLLFPQNYPSSNILGIMVDAAENKPNPTTNAVVPNQHANNAMPTSFTLIAPYGAAGSTIPFACIYKIIYSNPTAGALVISLSQDGTNASASQNVAAGGVWEINFPSNNPLVPNTLYHMAASASCLFLAFGTHM